MAEWIILPWQRTISFFHRQIVLYRRCHYQFVHHVYSLNQHLSINRRFFVQHLILAYFRLLSFEPANKWKVKRKSVKWENIASVRATQRSEAHIWILITSYHKPKMFDHCHRRDKYIFLMHITAILHHVRRIDRHSIHSYIAVNQTFRYKEKKLGYLYRVSVGRGNRGKNKCLHPARKAKAAINELLPAPLDRNKNFIRKKKKKKKKKTERKKEKWI